MFNNLPKIVTSFRRLNYVVREFQVILLNHVKWKFMLIYTNFPWSWLESWSLGVCMSVNWMVCNLKANCIYVHFQVNLKFASQNIWGCVWLVQFLLKWNWFRRKKRKIYRPIRKVCVCVRWQAKECFVHKST